MRKYRVFFIIFCVVDILLFSGCDNNEKVISEEKTGRNIIESDKIISETTTEEDGNSTSIEDNQSIKNDDQVNKKLSNNNYAIYMSSLVEGNEAEINKYVHYERSIHIQFPQFYYSNEFAGYDEEIEAQINNTLFSLGMRNDSGLLFERYRNLKEYYMDYMITNEAEDLISIKYVGYLYSIDHGQDFCYGITFDYRTGELSEITNYVDIDKSLINGIINKDVSYSSLSGYDEDFVINQVEEFIEDYHNGLVNVHHCFYVEDKKIYIIIPVSQGNSTYIILEMPLE